MIYSQNFCHWFGEDIEPKKSSYKIEVLKQSITDKEILAEVHPRI